MPNHIALLLGGFIFMSLVVDVGFHDSEHLIFLGKKLLELIEWMAVWR